MGKDRQIPNKFNWEIIDIEPLESNPNIGKCTIKIFYIGANRNGSYITKELGERMASGLPVLPIVGFVNEEQSDLQDHGREIVINRNGVSQINRTIPIGVVSETAPIYWEDYLDDDGVVRTYMVCTGYLWIGRYPYLKNIMTKEKGQSMELFPESIQGEWAKVPNEEEEFFIFSEASFSALCILGDDVEPCYEGASVEMEKNDEELIKSSINNYSNSLKTFSFEKEDFIKDFNDFMFELNRTLKNDFEEEKEGGEQMSKAIKDTVDVILNNKLVEDNVKAPESNEPIVNSELENDVEPEVADEPEIVDKPESIVEPEVEPESSEPEVEPETPDFTEKEKVEENEKFAILEQEKESLILENQNLMARIAEYEKADKVREDAKKDKLFAKFSEILSPEDMQSVMSLKEEETLEGIELKLTNIAFQKGVNFNLNSRQNVIVPKVNNTMTDDGIPSWVKAVEEKMKNK